MEKADDLIHLLFYGQYQIKSLFLQYINYVNIRRLGNCPNQKDIPSDKCANTLGLLALPIIAGCKSWNFRQ